MSTETELVRNAVLSPSGLLIPAPEGDQHAWVKPRGEPAVILVETPDEVFAAVTAAQEEGKRWVVFHEYSYGTPCYYPVTYFDDCSIQVTYKTKGRVTFGGVYAGNCPHCPGYFWKPKAVQA